MNYAETIEKLEIAIAPILVEQILAALPRAVREGISGIGDTCWLQALPPPLPGCLNPGSRSVTHGGLPDGRIVN